jgi:hypothetical protein
MFLVRRPTQIEAGVVLKNQFLPVFVPRFLAALCVFLLIGGLSLACILGVAWIGPTLGHGMGVYHASGEIVDIGPGRNFILESTTGQRMTFQCGTNCRASLGHMQRHLNEHAHTDVYYIDGPNQTLVALDVD